MSSKKNILISIKSITLKVVPDAKVLLFGSRAYGLPTEESDWDILVLTKRPVSVALKNSLHERLFPLSVQIGAFINTIVIQEDEWVNNPSYYSLHETIKNRMVKA